MTTRSDGSPARMLVVTAGVLLWIGAAAASASNARTPKAPPPTAPTQAGNFAGDDTCATCHEIEGKAIKTTLHGKAQNERTPAGSGHSCETCHGPGQKHVDSSKKEDIKRFTAMSAREINDSCLTCHSKGPHADWQGSMHDARNVSCTSCHSVHSPKSEKAQLKAVNVVSTCATCHKQEAMKIQRQGHMPVREGKMECTSCHSPHGSNNVRMLKTGNDINESCVSCHTEKRGPYVWEHAAGRENCASCHDPHGSNNDRMLVAKVPMLCQRCHISSGHPPTVYDATQLANGSNRMVGRGCVNCHSQIHGSNSPSGYRFLR